VKPVLRDQHVMQGEIVDPGAQETCESIGGRFHDRFPFHVERSVQQDGNACNRFKLLEQCIKTFILVLSNGLHACRTINVNDRRDFVLPFRANAFDE
jgi:hypothetical protein